MKKLFLVALSIAMASLLFTGCNKETAKISTVEDLQGKKIGVQKGTTSESWVSENITDNEKLLLSYNSGIDAALELKNGAIDAVIIDELPAKAIVEKNPDLEILDIKLTEESYSIAVKKGNTELL
ncbi:MAG: transporter substrate-binding domain-containing protein, partial [Oscillospiraceae bacterium]